MINKIHNIFSNRKSKPIGEYRKSAVTILIEEEEGQQNIVFEVRALSLKHQPGDIALPGGKIEKGELPYDAAIRETVEELNIKKEDFEIIGDMDYLITPYGTIIYPFVGILKGKIVHPNKDEVEKIIKIPIDFFIDTKPLLYQMEIGPINKDDFPYELIRGGEKYNFSKGKLKEYFYKYDEYVIWGFTAMVIKSFIDIIKNNKA